MSAAARVNLRDLQRNDLTTVVGAMHAIWQPVFGPCEDPICDQYGHLHYTAGAVNFAQRRAARRLAALGWTPDLFITALIGRLPRKVRHRTGLTDLCNDLFPAACDRVNATLLHAELRPLYTTAR